MADLKTDYQNDVLDTDVNTERTYNLVDANGNLIYEGIKIRETTVLATTGDNYGAPQINEQNETINQINNDLSELLVVGSITAYAGSTAPNGYLICDGSAISRTDYAKLFAVIGTTYGSGDGSTTFNIPDCREVALVGIGQNATHSITNHDTYTLGQFKDDQMQNHLHGLSFEYKGEGGSGGTDMQYSTYANTTGYVKNARNGNVTRGKRLGMNYIIKY